MRTGPVQISIIVTCSNRFKFVVSHLDIIITHAFLNFKLISWVQGDVKPLFSLSGSTHHWICTSNLNCRRDHHVEVNDSLGLFMGPLNLEVLLQVATLYSMPPDQNY